MRRWLVAAGLLAASTPAAAYVSAWVAPFDAFSSRDWGCFDEVNPFAFAFDERREVFAAYPDLLARSVAAKPEGVALIPVVVNDVWDADRKTVRALKSSSVLRYWLGDRERLRRHAEALVAAARPYDGIELDYEHVPAALWPRYAELVGRVAAALRPAGKKVVVDLEPYALDARAGEVAAAADRVKVMCYYERGELSDRPGPGASADWVEALARRALAVLPREKIALAFSLAATDWQVPLPLLPLRRHVRRLHFRRARELLAAAGTRPVWDDVFGAPYFRYKEEDRAHEVWYEDERTLGRKLEIARKLGLGASFWYLGDARPDLKAMGLCPRPR